MAETTFRIIGRVIDRKTGRGLGGLRVEAWDMDLIFDDFVGRDLTDEQGAFRIEIRKAYFRELFLDRRPDLFFKVFQENDLIVSTEGSVLWNVAVREIEVRIEVDVPTPEQLYKVHGRFLQPDGSPVGNAPVKAFDKRLGKNDELLGEDATDGTGHYEIVYRAEQFLNANKHQPDLFVCATYEDQDICSEVIYNARRVEMVDLVVSGAEYHEPPEYQQIMDQLGPLLQNTKLEDLSEEDIAFLARKTEIDSQYITYLAIAARRVSDIVEKLGQDNELPIELFYGLFRQHLPTSLSALRVQSPETLRNAMEASITQNIVADTISAYMDQTIEVFRSLVVEHAFEEPPEGSGKTSLGALLGTVQFLGPKIQTLLELYVHHEGPIQDFWEALGQNDEFSDVNIADIQYTLQLGALTQSHVPLVTQLKQDTTVTCLRDLARLDVGEWKNLLNTEVDGEKIGVPSNIPGEDEEERISNYAKTMARMLEDAFPTTTVAYRLDKDSELDTPLPNREQIRDFLLNNPEFEFGSTQIDQYRTEHPEEFTAVFTTVTDDVNSLNDLVDGLIVQMKTVQRIFKITPHIDRYDAMRVLLGNGFGSALSIARIAQRTFMTNYGKLFDSYWKARAIHANASQKAAMTLALFTKYNPLFNAPDLHVLPKHTEMIKDTGSRALRAGTANLETLFPGSFALCDCKHCRSVLSPAAYLVDLLAFLGQEFPEEPDKPSALKVLLERRPDLETLELSCENTNTPVPYVDLVNEILENAVARPDIPPDYQTTWMAEELRTNPEHTNHGAYIRLACEYIYPWDLPFDLWAEEARTYLDHLGVPRYLLMETFQTKSDTLDPKDVNDALDPEDVAIAAEYLRLTPLECRIITGTMPTMPGQTDYLQAFWGFGTQISINKMITALADVRLFLEKSGLSYTELCQLLRTRFINPDWFADQKAGLQISLDPDCNLQEATLCNLDETVLSKMHRFVRLWRKLDLDIRELDKILTALETSDIDDAFLLQLSYIQRLRADLRVPLLSMLSWWAKIDTETYHEKTQSLYEQIFLNKSVLNPEDKSFKLVALDGGTQTISDHASTVRAALEISAADLSLLIGAGETSEVPDILTLDNLSQLYRIVTFSKAMKLSIQDFLSLKRLSGLDPFTPSQPLTLPQQVTFQFTEKVRKLRASGFSIAELDYLLRHVRRKTESIVPAEEQIALILNEIREGLQKILAENTLVPDPTGELTAQKLGLLKWEDALIKQVINTLKGNITYETVLDAVPGLHFSDEFPAELKTRLSYKDADKKLQFTGFMTMVEKSLLQGLSTEEGYRTALDDLFVALRDFVSETMKAFEFPVFEVSLETLPQAVDFPRELKSKIYYDIDARVLRFSGRMSETEKTALLDLSENSDYQSAIETLFNAPFAFEPEGENRFLTATDISRLFDEPTTVEQRFGIVLEKLLPYLRKTLSESLVKQKLGEALNLEAKTIDQLLMKWVNSPIDPTEKAINVFLAPAFIESNPDLKLTATAFPKQFEAYILLDKIALIISRLKVASEDLALLFQRDVYEDDAWADLNTLPLSNKADAAALFVTWEKLIDLFHFRDSVLPGEPSLFESLNMLFNPEIPEISDETFARDKLLQALSAHTGWAFDDLTFLSDSLGFTSRTSYRDEQALVRLKDCFDLIKRLGVSAREIWKWKQVFDPFDESNESHPLENANSIKQAVKAKYDHQQWLAVAKPLRDVLREKQRAALVSYLVAHPDKDEEGQKKWENVNGLYEHFLIDVEMSPCMMTSRLKLAISSVQLFIQRCLMNQEEWRIPTPTIALDWKNRWEWMKNYRVWEASRRIFLYPENWIEPELRDDKSPFFKDLENELLQNEVTAATAEKVFLTYLEKLDEVARLEICGMYHQVETDDGTSYGKKGIDILHVFGRTRGTPHSYYYRQRPGDTLEWTPWERVDVDIEGDHLIPVIWNRRLYLFWPVFTEKAREEEHLLSKKPDKYWEIQMAWSEYRNGKWSAKKVSTEIIDPSDQGHITLSYDIRIKELTWLRSDFFFEIQIVGDGLEINCMLAQPLYPSLPVLAAKIQFIGCDNSVRVLYPDRIKSAFPPENSHVEFMTFVENKSFKLTDQFFSALEGKKIPDDILSKLKQLKQEFANEKEFLNALEERIGPEQTVRYKELILKHAENKDADRPLSLAFRSHKNVIAKTPGTFRIVCPHQFEYFTFQDSFFYQDDTRTFFVTPYDVYKSSKPAEDEGEPAEVGDGPVVGWSGSVEILDSDDPTVGFGGNEVRDPVDILPGENMGRPFDTYLDLGMHLEYFIKSSFDPKVEILLQGTDPSSPDMSSLVDTKTAITLNKKATSGVSRARTTTENGGSSTSLEKHYRFEIFYHPYVREFIKHLNRDGIDGLLRRDIQMTESGEHMFKDEYAPEDVVGKPYPHEDVDFQPGGSYALYNWEIFFHAPLLIADRLSKNQRFEEALKWFHYIFDPTDISGYPEPQRFWNVSPFFKNAAGEPIQELMDLLNEEKVTGGDLTKLVEQWREDPFQPHLIARLRISAYQKTVVMKYIDTLIAWGDQLFRRDTIESINQATQLYILAAGILGERPENIAPQHDVPVRTFNELQGCLDAFSNAMVQLENSLPSLGANDTMLNIEKQAAALALGPSLYLCDSAIEQTLYFCIPKNDKLLPYWDTLADRLFKIRHCMNIEGVVRQLPLFEPPIEPGLLVRAAAAGVDISSALSDLNAPLPYYRFQFMLQKTFEFCNDVKSLGASLLSALEKKDAEALALLRSRHEIQLLKAARQIKKQQIEEAKEAKKALEKSKELAEKRKEYYSSREYMNAQEQLHLDKLESAHDWQMIAQWIDIAASIAHLLPTFNVGIAGGLSSPVSTVGLGGPNVGNALQAAAGVMRALSAIDSYEANRASIKGGYDRRADDWTFQAEQAGKEIEQIDKQIVAAEIRLAIAEKDLENHDQQVENAKEVDTYMHDKFTNQELYNWMVSQISSIYFQSYQLAYDLAKRAEKAFQHELADYDKTFINFGYWDSLKKGLLSGEKLHYDLRRMEVAYLEQNKREYEISKHISLVMLDPLALVKLKETGECFVSLPEALFDLDYPGHYMRRIKSVSLTIPCVTGPYTSVNCTLTLLGNRVRKDTSTDGVYKYQGIEDRRFQHNIGAIQSIATSNAQNDSGVFELNFRDERYLPFEGAGVISEWRLELPNAFRQFDYDTISDVVFHINYTAREGGATLKEDATGAIISALPEEGLVRMFSAKHEFPGEWHKFLHPTETADVQDLQFGLKSEQFPFLFHGKTITVNAVTLFFKLKDGFTYNDSKPLTFYLYNDGESLVVEDDRTTPKPLEFRKNGSPITDLPFTGLTDLSIKIPGSLKMQVKETDLNPLGAGAETDWWKTVKIDDDNKIRLKPEAIDGILIVAQYSVK